MDYAIHLNDLVGASDYFFKRMNNLVKSKSSIHVEMFFVKIIAHSSFISSESYWCNAG